MIYSDPIITKYIDLIKSKTDIFKGYYQGDPVRIPTSKLPCIIISKNRTELGQLSNVEDEQAMSLILTVVTDIRKDISDEKALAPGTASLYNIIEGREDDTLKLKTESILHILRNNLNVDISLGLRTNLGSVTSADYGMTIGKREPSSWSIEANIDFEAYFTQVR